MSKFTPNKLNKFLLLKLPSAYISGVRVKEVNDNDALVTVKHRWINQNPFQSMYWVTQGMASELATGILVMKKIQESGQKISMLVLEQKGEFTKKAKGRIRFTCTEGEKIDEVIKRVVESGNSETITLCSEGFDEQNDKVSRFEYTWGIKLKQVN